MYKKLYKISVRCRKLIMDKSGKLLNGKDLNDLAV